MYHVLENTDDLQFSHEGTIRFSTEDRELARTLCIALREEEAGDPFVKHYTDYTFEVLNETLGFFIPVDEYDVDDRRELDLTDLEYQKLDKSTHW